MTYLGTRNKGDERSNAAVKCWPGVPIETFVKKRPSLSSRSILMDLFTGSSLIVVVVVVLTSALGSPVTNAALVVV